MIKIPEIIIKEELEKLIRRYYDDYVALEQVTTVIDASDVNSGVFINVVQQGSSGIPEITEVITPNGSALSEKYWLLNTPTTYFYVWYNVDGLSTQPSVPNKIGIQVSVLSTDTESEVAQKTRDAIASFTTYFTATVLNDKVTITNKETTAVNRSLLYGIFGGITFDNMDYLRSMAAILKARYGSEARKLTINLGYNKNREAFPQVSILLPSEENDPKYTGVVQGSTSNNDGTYSEKYVHNFQTTYTLFITSDNYNEVILVYHFLKTLFLVGMDNFTCRGLNNIWVSGRDITMDFDIDPALLYHRTVAVSFFYENEVMGLNSITPATGITYQGTLIP